jgi:TRAP-type transport system periplasmic protein
MKRRPWFAPALLAVWAAVAGLAAPPAHATVIKLATLVPEGSVWDKILRQMGEDWKGLTGGRVELRIYSGGVAGDEGDVVRKMRIGQLQAGAVMASGLSEIDPAFRVFQIPLFFRSYDELYHVLEATRPAFEKRLEAKGFVLLNWGFGGWVHAFTKEPVRSADGLKKQRIFTWAGDDKMVGWWKKNGFEPVALAYTDIMMGLQSGMIDAFPTTPLAALSYQWYRLTPYMPDLGLGPLVGGTIVNLRDWQRLSETDRAALTKAARETEGRMEKEIPDQDERAVAAMKERGLTVVKVEGTPDEASWRQVAEGFGASMRGSLVPAEVYDLVLKERDAYRAAKGGS